MATTTVKTINDPVYNQILSETFDIESEQGRILWNLFRFNVEYDPSEEVYTDAEGNLVDKKTATAGAVTFDQAKKELLKEGYTAKEPSGQSFDEWWNGLGERTQDNRYQGNKNSNSAKAAYNKENGPTIYKDPEGNTITADDWEIAINTRVSDSVTNAGADYTKTTRGDYEGYDAEGTVSESELMAQGIGYQSRALAEREPIRTAFNKKALEGLDTEKYARQAAGDAADTYDASRQGLTTNLALRGVAPSEANMGDNMERAQVIGGAKTQGRNWAETESFNRLSAALNAPA